MHNLPSIVHKDTLPGFWEWDMIKQTTKNAVLLDSLGYTEEELTPSENYWEQLIHPDDWQKLIFGISNYTRTNPQNPFVEEIRFYHKNGSILYALLVGKITEINTYGVATKMVGSHIDITSKRHAKRNLMRVTNLLNETSRTAMTGGWELELGTNELIWTDVTRDIYEVDKHYQPVRGGTFGFFKEGESRNSIISAINDAVANAVPYDLEVEIITQKGNSKWIRCTCQPAFEDDKCVRLFGVVQDITEKKLAKEALRIKQQQLTTFIKHCPVAMCMLDKDLNYIAASDIWKAFFTLNDEDITGRNQFDVFPATPEIWRERYNRGLSGEVLKMDEDSFSLPDGSVVWLEWEIRPWHELPGQIRGIIIFVAIISEKHAFKEALIKARDEAEKSSLMKSRFLSVMSHEMRTPLNAVIGFINLLMQNPRPDQIENMNVLRFSAENLLLLIDDMLDFTKLDTEKVSMKEEAFNLTLLLQNIVALLKHEADTKRLDLKLDLDTAIPELVLGDAARLGQVIIKLVNNAIKFTQVGTVVVSCHLKEQNEDSATIDFEIRDTGIGIPANQQENIFDLFSQAESGNTRKYGGTGLGLSISKKLLELMGSQIRLKSVPSEGSSFSFQIVFNRVGSANSKTQHQFEENPCSPVLDGARILIVEDNPINILLMKKILTQWKCHCSLAQDGSIACDLVKHNDYDLILMDLQMPVMDGIQATRTIRNLRGEKYRNIPIIALSATDKTEIEAELIEVGINDFISKPFAPKQLNSILVRYLSR